MRVRFLRDYDYTPSLNWRVTLAYPAGFFGSVKRECGEAAIACGAAIEVYQGDEMDWARQGAAQIQSPAGSSAEANQGLARKGRNRNKQGAEAPRSG